MVNNHDSCKCLMRDMEASYNKKHQEGSNEDDDEFGEDEDGFLAKTVRKTELRIVRNRETKKIFKVLNFWTRRGTRRRFEDPSRYATDLKYLKSSGFLRGTRSPLLASRRDLDFELNDIVRIVDYCLDDG
ncbi:hypothetical protein E3N88_19687 [Mikania micrantha]|uniref:Uncharacterized protein n=1 Tax=Mikania micrantha TaxID=192012 RepID=A0A5N6NP63_9ASTR|nr:hypothetical protein E3N88_19687 [Mikania micrantha]